MNYVAEHYQLLLDLAAQRREKFGGDHAKLNAEIEQARRARDDEIRRLRRAGASFNTIAREFGLTDTRVQQICKGD